MKMLSFAAENADYDKLNFVSIQTGLSRSELLREGLRDVLLRYSVEESFDSEQDNVPKMLKQILTKLERRM